MTAQKCLPSNLHKIHRRQRLAKKTFQHRVGVIVDAQATGAFISTIADFHTVPINFVIKILFRLVIKCLKAFEIEQVSQKRSRNLLLFPENQFTFDAAFSCFRQNLAQ